MKDSATGAAAAVPAHVQLIQMCAGGWVSAAVMQRRNWVSPIIWRPELEARPNWRRPPALTRHRCIGSCARWPDLASSPKDRRSDSH